jgi:hypothetical protein
VLCLPSRAANQPRPRDEVRYESDALGEIAAILVSDQRQKVSSTVEDFAQARSTLSCRPAGTELGVRCCHVHNESVRRGDVLIAESRDRRTEGGNAGVELAASKSQLTLELVDASSEKCELPILRGDDDLQAGVRLDTDLTLVSAS